MLVNRLARQATANAAAKAAAKAKVLKERTANELDNVEAVLNAARNALLETEDAKAVAGLWKTYNHARAEMLAAKREAIAAQRAYAEAVKASEQYF